MNSADIALFMEAGFALELLWRVPEFLQLAKSIATTNADPTNGLRENLRGRWSSPKEGVINGLLINKQYVIKLTVTGIALLF